MITTTIWGGLGNQMFMYAAAKAMALRNHTQYAFNLKQGFIDDKLFNRHLELTNFNLTLPTAKVSTFDIPFGKGFRYISRKLGFNILKPWMEFIRESDHPDPRDIVNNSTKHAYLQGYWGSEKYFLDIKDIIKRDFTIREELLGKHIFDELDHMRSLGNNLVMLGVRRYQECAKSSYIPKDGLNADEAYYRKALDYIASKVEHPVFVVFSQAQEWVKQNIDDGRYPFYYAKPKTGDLSAVEDFYLMKQCNHFIISNSTYYWWAAWLSKTDSNIVVCPRYSNDKLLCSGWTQIK